MARLETVFGARHRRHQRRRQRSKEPLFPQKRSQRYHNVDDLYRDNDPELLLTIKTHALFSISIVVIDLLSLWGPVLVAARCHHTLETHSRTHARTPNPRRKTIKKLLTHCRERNAKNHEETPKYSRSRAHALIFCYTDRFCSFYLVSVRVDHLRKSH